MNRTTTLFAALVAGVLLAYGGYEVRKSMICAGLQDDYLNAISDMKNKVQAKSYIGMMDSKPSSDLDYMITIDQQRIESSLLNIYNRCGDRAAETAKRKGTELIF